MFWRSCSRWISIPTLFARLSHEYGGDGFDFSLSKPLNGYHFHAMLCDTRLSIVDVAEGTQITQRIFKRCTTRSEAIAIRLLRKDYNAIRP